MKIEAYRNYKKKKIAVIYKYKKCWLGMKSFYTRSCMLTADSKISEKKQLIFFLPQSPTTAQCGTKDKFCYYKKVTGI